MEPAIPWPSAATPSASTACAQEEGAELQALVGDVELSRDGKCAAQAESPEKRSYVSSAMPMTEAAIDTGLLRDVYVSLGEPIDKDRPDAPGSCASISNPSSTGSGAAAC